MVGFLCSCIVFTPVFLHSFLLHKTILYYFLVFFSFSFCCWSPSHFYLYTLLAVTSHILLIIIYLTLFFFFLFCLLLQCFIIIIDLRALVRSLFLSLSRFVILSSARSIYICFHLFSCCFFVFPLINVFFFLVCFWF